MKTSTFALLLGLLYLAMGVLGLAPVMLAPPPAEPPPTTFTLLYGYLLTLFPTNVLLSLLRILTGIWGLMAFGGVSNPALFSRSAALLYGALAVMGMIPLANTLFGWIPIHGNDVWLHGITAAFAAYFGWRSEVQPADRRSGRMDRRYHVDPVALERRRGLAERRFAHARMIAGV